MHVVGVVTSAQDALQGAQTSQADLIILDLEHPEGAITLGKKIMQIRPAAKLVSLSSGEDNRLADDAVKAGFQGCITKDATLGRLFQAISSALSGDVVISNKLTGAASADQRRAQALAGSLTRREREILGLLVDGMSSTTIARTLSISRNTLRTHISSILLKLQVHSRLEAVTFATQHRILASA